MNQKTRKLTYEYEKARKEYVKCARKLNYPILLLPILYVLAVVFGTINPKTRIPFVSLRILLVVVLLILLLYSEYKLNRAVEEKRTDMIQKMRELNKELKKTKN